MFNSNALTKIQSIILIAIVAFAAGGGGAAYVLLSGNVKSTDTIKIGVFADLDGARGKGVWQGAVLAAEQLNAEGGILGKQVEVIGEDNDQESGSDMSIMISALIRLLTYHEVDFVIGASVPGLMDLIAEHKKIYIAYVASTDESSQRVTDDYDKYKNFFKYYPANSTQVLVSVIHELLFFREMTGFNKVGYLANDHPYVQEILDGLDNILPEHGFDLVYKGKFPPLDTFDFSSYLAIAEAAGVEILMPLMAFDNGISFVKEYYDRQSPMVVFGGHLDQGAGQIKSWEQTDGKCKYIASIMSPITAGYPLTSKTLPFRDSYIEMWDEVPSAMGASTYDIIRFLLPDALERAGTLETEAVIEALEDTHIETSLTRSFRFTSNHDVFYGEGMLSSPDSYGHIRTLFQWQEDGSLVPIYPKWLMEEAGATYTFPDWPGPWD